MSPVTSPTAPRGAPARGSRDKVEERRAELAGAALQTLAELGYARTSLREIAQNSAFSHGVLHYYFTDKVDLIMYCVRRYKAQCVTRYDEVVATAGSAQELREGFGRILARTLADDAPMHRLWYDLRGQSMFEASFRPDVAEIDQSLQRMIWRILTQYAQLSGAGLALTPDVAYAFCDGLFHQALLRHLAGDTGAAEQLRVTVEGLLPTLLTDLPTASTSPAAVRG
jgi:AcrR family transcriptional regulator